MGGGIKHNNAIWALGTREWKYSTGGLKPLTFQVARNKSRKLSSCKLILAYFNQLIFFWYFCGGGGGGEGGGVFKTRVSKGNPASIQILASILDVE